MSFIGGVLNNQNERRQLYMVPRSCNTPSRGSRMIRKHDYLIKYQYKDQKKSINHNYFETAFNCHPKKNMPILKAN
jgi:hypothetical protein